MVEAERVYTLKNNFGAITDGTAALMEVGAVEIGIGVKRLHRWWGLLRQTVILIGPGQWPSPATPEIKNSLMFFI